MPRVFVAAGSNVDPERNLARAATELARSFPGTRFSPCYRNPAVGFEGPEFLNFVAEIPTEQPVRAVLASLHRIEALCGRARNAPRWEPRAMDLDILMYGSAVSGEADLRLPRPDLLTKAYMLGPMADLAPEVMHPTAARTIGELWADFDRSAHPMRRCELSPAEPPAGGA